MNKPAVCIATIRPQEFGVWAKAWQEEFLKEKVKVFVMIDGMSSEEFLTHENVYHHHLDIRFIDHLEVMGELKDKAWIIPKRTSACKSFAIYKAWKAGCDPIMVLDDDCLPVENSHWINDHRTILQNPVHNHIFLTIRYPFPRGFPHLPDNPVAISHGLWLQNPDVYSHMNLSGRLSNDDPYEMREMVVPLGCLFPMSGMNLAFRREIAPLMYFGLQGPDWGVDRFDDIWCGFLAKKVLDHCGYAVWSGTPYVRHIKASDPFVNIVKEAPGYKMNVEFYEWVMKWHGRGWEKEVKRNPINWLWCIAQDMIAPGFMQGEYWQNYGKAILEWLELFKPEEAFGI